MQAPFAFDSDGNLVASAKIVEALGLGKSRESQNMTKADPGEVIRAVSEEIKDGEFWQSLADLSLRLDSESANWRAAREALREEVAVRHDASEADISILEARMSDLEARVEDLARKMPG